CKYQRLFTAWTVFANGMHVAIKVMECRMGYPGLVKVQRVNFTAQLLFDHLDVVADTIVSALCDGENAWLLVFYPLGERVIFNFLANTFGFEFVKRDRADNTQVVACRAQENRNCA